MINASQPPPAPVLETASESQPPSDLHKLRNWLLLLVVCSIGIFYAIFAYRTFVLHYYPTPPFLFDEGDSLADWINTCAWSDRSDRYTAWQSLYTPFSHFICTIANLVFGQVPPGYYSGWRQYSISIKFIVLMHIFLWLTILLPIKPFPAKSSFWHNFRYYALNVFPLRLLSFFSYSVMFSFERGNTIGVAYLFFWFSIRASYNPRIRYLCHPLFVGAAAAIKPYILVFSLYGRRFSGLIISFLTVVILQVIPILIVGAPGIENLPENIAFYSKEYSIVNVVVKAVYTFSFNGYRDMKRLVDFGIGSEMLGIDYTLYLSILYSISIVLFCALLFSAIRCSITAIKVDRLESDSSIQPLLSDHSKLLSASRDTKNSRIVLLRYAIPSFINVMIYMIFSQSSGAYVVLFLLVAIFCIEEETFIISRSPFLLGLYFMAFCVFDLPALSSKAYECGIRSIPIIYFRQIPLLSELTGQQFICMGSYIGPAALLRPIFFLLFGVFLLLKLRRHIKLSHHKLTPLSPEAGYSSTVIHPTTLDSAGSS
jgi:hypothetical protein